MHLLPGVCVYDCIPEYLGIKVLVGRKIPQTLNAGGRFCRNVGLNKQRIEIPTFQCTLKILKSFKGT